MTKYEMFGSAEWVAPSEECANPYVRGNFELGNFEKAVITVCGVGFYNFYINGQRGSEDLFVTLYTDYSEHKMPFGEVLRHRLICQRYDITSLLQKGDNSIGFLLGRGYYNCAPTPPYELFPVCGDVSLCFSIEVTALDGSVSYIVSDEKMKWSPSFITKCETFTRGETHNYSLEQPGWNNRDFDDSAWKNVLAIAAPETNYTFSACPPDRIIRHIKPVVVSENSTSRIYDVGENITGWMILHNDGNFSGEAEIHVYEKFCNGELTHDYKQYFTAILDNCPRYFHPELTWHGFRYVEVPLGIEMTDCCVIHSDVKVTAEFRSSNEVLNWLFEAYIRTQLNNMHAGIPMDCPTEERAGYTGDGQLCCEAAMTMLKAKEFYRKWIDDIADCQDSVSGHVQYTAPYAGGRGGGPGGWGCAIVEVPYIYHKMYGDTDLLKSLFGQMVHYIDYLEAHSEDGLVTSDQPGQWCLGDWCTAEKIKLPEPYVNTYFKIKSIDRILEIAKITGMTEQNEKLILIREKSEKAMYNGFFDSTTGDFCGNYQASNAFALDLGLGDSRTLENMVHYYEEYGMFDCGIFGTDILLRVLFNNGYSQTAFNLLTNDGEYSFAAWKTEGSTTLHEYWTGGRSLNHPMFGACTKYLFQYILGIRQEKDSTGFEKIIVAPSEIDLEYVSGSIETVRGTVSVTVVRKDNKTQIEVSLPSGIMAKLCFNSNEKELCAGNNVFCFPEIT